MRAGDLDEQAAADLFAYFYSARFFEKPGDAGRGKSIFSAKHCAECHGLTKAILPAAKPVTQWESMSRPVALVAAMWNHGATMQKEFAQREAFLGPILTSQDLTDILVYVRNLPGTRASTGPAAAQLRRERPVSCLSRKGARAATSANSRWSAGCEVKRSPTSRWTCGITRPEWPGRRRRSTRRKCAI